MRLKLEDFDIICSCMLERFSWGTIIWLVALTIFLPYKGLASDPKFLDLALAQDSIEVFSKNIL